MSIALFAVPGVLAPLQGLWRWLMPGAAPGRPVVRLEPDSCGRHVTGYANAAPPGVKLQNLASIAAHRPLRIVRILEAGQAPTHVGRMMISGRMADVCAELDRLAAREATLH